MERGEGTGHAQKGQAATQAFGTEKHELKLGKSFQQDNSCGFHTIRYDFKPASVDHSREAKLGVGESNEISIKFPNVENKGPENTVFAGSKRPYQKECVLIFDHRTGEFTLEKLSCNIQVKRQRQEGTSKAQLAPKKPLKGPVKNSPNARARKKESAPSSSSSSAHSPAPPADIKVEKSPAPQPSPLTTSEPSPAPTSMPSGAPADHDSSDSYMSASDSDDEDRDEGGDDDSSSSSSSGSSSSDEEVERAPIAKPRTESRVEVERGKPSPVQPSSNLQQLSEDLQLSESGSDSDSD